MNQESLILNENDVQNRIAKEESLSSKSNRPHLEDDVEDGNHQTSVPLEEPLLTMNKKKDVELRGLPSVGKARVVSSQERDSSGFYINTGAFGHKELKFVKVTAPMTMPSDAKFLARLVNDDGSGRVFEVTVPDGGVVEGQEFHVFYPKRFLKSTVIPPYGKWKDHICSCFNLAICHFTVWTTFLCPLLSVAQLLTRLQLTCCATQTTKRGAKSTFIFLLFYTGVISSYFIVAIVFGFHFDWMRKRKYQAAVLVPIFAYIIYTMFLTIRARNVVRHRYNIQPSHNFDTNNCSKRCCCKDEEHIPIRSEEEVVQIKKFNGICEDIACGIFCTQCTICQLSRQTADYLSYDGTLFQRNGLPKHTPFI